MISVKAAILQALIRSRTLEYWTHKINPVEPKVLCKFAKNFTVSPSPPFYVRERVSKSRWCSSNFEGVKHERNQENEHSM
jgi:hypothetical protein